MKELSIEEKAKAYDVAIKKAKSKIKDDKDHVLYEDDIIDLFPELAESEDEKMVQYFKDLAPFDKADELYEKYGFSHKDAIAWLEKQSKHANFINKIQIGDKVTRNEDGVLVNLSQLKRVAKKDEKQDVQKPSEKIEPKFKIGDWIICRNGEDALYQITDSIPTGYMIKGDDGIIHSVTFEQLVNCNATLSVIQNQKPTKWSEEDNHYLCGLIGLIEQSKAEIPITFEGKAADNFINWLKSLKDRYTWKPSDEQMEALLSTLPVVKGGGDKVQGILESLYQDLKKLKEE